MFWNKKEEQKSLSQLNPQKTEDRKYTMSMLCFNCGKESHQTFDYGSSCWFEKCENCGANCLIPSDFKDKFIVNTGDYKCI